MLEHGSCRFHRGTIRTNRDSLLPTGRGNRYIMGLGAYWVKANDIYICSPLQMSFYESIIIVNACHFTECEFTESNPL